MKKNLKNIKKNTKNSLKIEKIMGIGFFGRNSRQLLDYLESRENGNNNKIWIVTVNPEFMVKMKKDSYFKELINRADLRVMDGIGLVWSKKVLSEKGFFKKFFKGIEEGVKILKGKGRDRVIAGSDLMNELSKVAAEKNRKVFFLGGWGDRARLSGENLKVRYHGLKYDYCEGEPNVNNITVLRKINEFKPDYLFVAYGMKKQEEWIVNNLNKLNCKVIIGVGRSFDYYSGALKRAPKLWQNMGLEWLYSLIQEPKRWRRQLALPQFIWMVLTNKNN